MKKSKWIALLFGGFLLLIGIGWLNSYSLLIRLSNLKNVQIVYAGFNIGHEYRAVSAEDDRGEPVLALLQRNNLGLWQLVSKSDTPESDEVFLSLGWHQPAGWKQFEFQADPISSIEWHLLYYGNNALKLLEINSEDIPASASVNIQQTGREFLIHVISFDAAEALNQIDVHDALVRSGMVPAS